MDTGWRLRPDRLGLPSVPKFGQREFGFRASGKHKTPACPASSSNASTKIVIEAHQPKVAQQFHSLPEPQISSDKSASGSFFLASCCVQPPDPSHASL